MMTNPSLGTLPDEEDEPLCTLVWEFEKYGETKGLSAVARSWPRRDLY